MKTCILIKHTSGLFVLPIERIEKGAAEFIEVAMRNGEWAKAKKKTVSAAKKLGIRGLRKTARLNKEAIFPNSSSGITQKNTSVQDVLI